MDKPFTRSLGKYGTLSISGGKAAIYNSSDNPTLTFPLQSLYQALSDMEKEKDSIDYLQIAVLPHIKRCLSTGADIIDGLSPKNVVDYISAIKRHPAYKYIHWEICNNKNSNNFIVLMRK